MKDWMKDSESTNRKDSAVWVHGAALYVYSSTCTAVIILPSRNTCVKVRIEAGLVRFACSDRYTNAAPLNQLKINWQPIGSQRLPPVENQQSYTCELK